MQYMQTLNWNSASWVGRDQLVGPCFYVHMYGRASPSIGSIANIRSCFRRTYRHHNDTFSNQQWHLQNNTTFHCRWDNEQYHFMALLNCGKAMQAIYQTCFTKVNQKTAHNGSSTYAKMTHAGGVSKLISEPFKEKPQHFVPLILEGAIWGAWPILSRSFWANMLPSAKYCEHMRIFLFSWGRLSPLWENARFALTLGFRQLGHFPPGSPPGLHMFRTMRHGQE